MQRTAIVTIVIAIIFVCGAGAITYYGRPIMTNGESQKETSSTAIFEENTSGKIENKPGEKEPKETTKPNSVSSKPATTSEPTPQAANTYTSTQVATHATESNCWSAVGGNVYDLTSWVSRHPGGSKSIISMCGMDATSKFEKVHGGSSAAKAALALLKIGTLVQ